MGKLVDLSLTTLDILRNQLNYKFKKDVISVSEKAQKLLDEVLLKGYAVVPDFFSPQECQDIITEVDAKMKEFEEGLWQDPQKADSRLFGINRVSDLINDKFYNHSLIKEMREGYYNIKDNRISGFTMAGKIVPKKDNLGSGGGWHRDTVNRRQFKSIVYLNDVSEKNGPFQYVDYTHYKNSVLKGIWDYGFKYNHYRFNDAELNTVLAAKEEYQLNTLTAKAGTLLLVDTSGIHRGMPIEEGVRYALTNYYWTSNKPNQNAIPKKVNDTLLIKKGLEH